MLLFHYYMMTLFTFYSDIISDITFVTYGHRLAARSIALAASRQYL